MGSGLAWICEISVANVACESGAMRDWLSRLESRRLSVPDGLLSLDAYVPAAEASRDPYNQGETAPLLILIADFEGEQALRQAMQGAAIGELLEGLPQGVAVTVSAFRRQFYPVGDGSVHPLEAPVSYVVRYTRPAEDEAEFTRVYVETHPTTQARLPGIRAIMCYFPLHHLTAQGWPAVDYMIGNEVVFDSAGDFNTAMQSPARLELRAHFHEFPAFSGEASHHLMQRKRLHDARIAQ